MSSVVLVILALVLLLTGDGVLALGMLILSLIAFRELTKACGVIAEGQKNNALEYTVPRTRFTGWACWP